MNIKEEANLLDEMWDDHSVKCGEPRYKTDTIYLICLRSENHKGHHATHNHDGTLILWHP